MDVPYCKLCGIEDFSRSEIRLLIRRGYRDLIDLWGPEFPSGHENRKHWEIAQTIRGLRDFGAVREVAEILGVGAGAEQTTFWLTNHVRRVHATDLYLGNDDWGAQCPTEMLSDPGRFALGRWNDRRLVVQHMNGLDLRFEDATFDGVFSSNSIEHFGSLANVSRAAREMCRVLRPGGIAAITTEFCVSGPPDVFAPGTIMFDSETLNSAVIRAADWTLVAPLDLSVSPETQTSGSWFEDILERAERGEPHGHVLLRHQTTEWLPVSLVLRRN